MAKRASRVACGRCYLDYKESVLVRTWFYLVDFGGVGQRDSSR